MSAYGRVVLTVKRDGLVESVSAGSFGFRDFADCEILEGEAYYIEKAVKAGAKPKPKPKPKAKTKKGER